MGLDSVPIAVVAAERLPLRSSCSHRTLECVLPVCLLARVALLVVRALRSYGSIGIDA